MLTKTKTFPVARVDFEHNYCQPICRYDESIIIRPGSSNTTTIGSCELEGDDHVSSGRESIVRSSTGERTKHLARSTSDSSQPECQGEMEIVSRQPQRQISNTSNTSDDIQPKQILQRVRKVLTDSRSDKEDTEERELSSHSVGNISISNQLQEDVTKQFITSSSMIEVPKSWAGSVLTNLDQLKPRTSTINVENSPNQINKISSSTDTSIDDDETLDNEYADEYRFSDDLARMQADFDLKIDHLSLRKIELEIEFNSEKVNLESKFKLEMAKVMTDLNSVSTKFNLKRTLMENKFKRKIGQMKDDAKRKRRRKTQK